MDLKTKTTGCSEPEQQTGQAKVGGFRRPFDLAIVSGLSSSQHNGHFAAPLVAVSGCSGGGQLEHEEWDQISNFGRQSSS